MPDIYDTQHSNIITSVYQLRRTLRSQPFKNDEKCLSFYLKSFFRSQGI